MEHGLNTEEQATGLPLPAVFTTSVRPTFLVPIGVSSVFHPRLKNRSG
jgi:hypothetical protein